MDIAIKFLIVSSLLMLTNCRSIEKGEDSKENKKEKSDEKESKEDAKNSAQPKSETDVQIRSDGSNGYLQQTSGLGNDLLTSVPSDNHLTGYPASAANLEKLLGANGIGIGELPGSHQPNLGHGGINEGLRPAVPHNTAGHANNVPPPGFHNGVTPGVLGNGGLLRPGFGGLGNGIFGGIGSFGLNGGQLGLLFGNVLLQAIANFIQNAQPLIANMAG